MTTEVLTPENTCLWTSHVRNNTLLRCHKKSSFQTNTCQNERHDARSYDQKKKKRLPDQATFHLQSVQDRQLKKLQ